MQMAKRDICSIKKANKTIRSKPNASYKCEEALKIPVHQFWYNARYKRYKYGKPL